MSFIPPPVTPPVKKRSKKLILGVAGGAALALCCGGAVIAAASSDPKPSGKSIAAPTTAAATATVTSTANWPPPGDKAPAATEEAAYTPKARDFTLKVKILDKQCFGSAGCNVTYRVVPEYSGLPLGDGVTTEVTYEVAGLEDTATSTFTMTGTMAELDTEESGSTTSSSKKLTAKVTSVEVMP